MSVLRNLRYARRYRNWREMVRARREGHQPPRVELREGVIIEAPPEVSAPRLVNEVFFRRVYTPPGHEIGSEDVVVDVGANIGIFTLYAATRSRGRIVAVEPFPGNVAALRRNLALNGQERVEVMACALADGEGTARLMTGGRGTTHTISGSAGEDAGSAAAEPHADAEEIEVPTHGLASLLASLGLERIDFLKLDCEGGEGLIFQAAGPELLGRIGRIAMEFHDQTSSLSHAEIQKRLEEAGFRTWLRWDGGSTLGNLYAARQ